MATETEIASDMLGSLRDYAAEYVQQIKVADDEVATILMKEFGRKAFERGYRAACRKVVDMVEPMSR